MNEKHKRKLKRKKFYKQKSLYRLFRVNPLYQLLKSLENNQESTKLVNNLFWGFNLLLIFFLIINEFFGDFFVPVFRLLSKGHSLTNVSFYSLLLYSIVLIGVFVGLKLKEKPAFKLKVLFGLEIPLLLIVIIRQEMLYDLNLSLKYLFLLFFALVLIYWIQIYIQHNKTNSIFLPVLKLRKLLLFAFGIFFSALFIFTTVPLGLVLLKNSLLNFRIIEDLYLIGYLIINLLLIFMLILVFNPALFAFRYSLKSFKQMICKFNWKAKANYLISILILFSALYFLNISSPDYMYLELKKEPSLIKQKEMFFKSTDKLKQELRQIDSLKYYYLGSVQNNFFCHVLEYEFDMNSTQKKFLQHTYNLFMFPFFYQDTEKIDYEIENEVNNIYEYYFDQPIYESSYNFDYGDSFTAVHIDKQEVDVNEYGDIAEIEICETYSTKSKFSQEIVYHFALPYNSVITGLWISDDKNLDKKYPGLVAPSGAAQKVYENEVRKQVDPALLSHIGTNEYLLRAFPVMSKERISQDTSFDIRYVNNYQFRLWYRYKTFISKNNNWKLPKLLYNWNVNWSDETKIFINGEISNRLNSWLPNHVVATKSTMLKEHTAIISDSVQISSKSIELHEWIQSNDNIAFLIDGSYSMNRNRKKLTDKFGEIKEMFPNFKEMDCFIAGKEITKVKAGQLLDEINSNPQLFFGNTNYMEMLEKFTIQFKGYANIYKSVILISDIADYRYPEDGIIWEYGEQTDTLKPGKLACPFIIIQLLEENYQVDPNDFFYQLVQKSSGGFAKNKQELLNLLYTNNKHIDNLVVFQNGIAYLKSNVSVQTDTLFMDFATKEFINHYKLGDSSKLVDIDVLNDMAKKEQIVTKYSSMVALVNQEQIDSLKSAETHLDRYNNFRESNSSGDGVMGLLNMFGSSVPKHSENVVVFMFLLLICAMIFADRFR